MHKHIKALRQRMAEIVQESKALAGSESTEDKRRRGARRRGGPPHV